ncbi:MAG: hypothetical protein Q7R30_00110 [Acidobacteriota bacterium]|nr:hypothetical protein [Acidobacteriota bacterium]
MGELSRRDRAWAAGIGLLTLALFVVTLRSGVGGPEDSPKFQFVGRVLGTAHSPGPGDPRELAFAMQGARVRLGAP